jgi:hypothetical protein
MRAGEKQCSIEGLHGGWPIYLNGQLFEKSDDPHGIRRSNALTALINEQHINHFERPDGGHKKTNILRFAQ